MLLPLLALFFTFLAACGEDNGQAVLGESSNESASWRITPTDRIYTLEDFTNIGFKKSKTYDVVDLPQAESAYFGFWGLDLTTDMTTRSGSTDRILMLCSLVRNWRSNDQDPTRKSPKRRQPGRSASRMPGGASASSVNPRTQLPALSPNTMTTRSLET